MLRGGSWNNNGNNTRSANRNMNNPTNRNNNNGFRVVARANTLRVGVLQRNLQESDGEYKVVSCDVCDGIRK